MITPNSQTSQGTPNWNKKSQSKNQILLQKRSLKLLSGIIFLSLHSQSDIASFAIANFQLDNFLWQLNFSNYTKLK